MSHIGRRVMSIGMAGAALLATTAILSAQDPIRACAKPQGQLRLLATAGESCLPSERPVEWPASTPPSGGGLKIVDFNGAMLGWWVGSVLVETDNGWVTFFMDVNGPRSIPYQLYFDTPCPASGLHAPTDAPHMQSAGPFLQRGGVLDAGRILYPGPDALGFHPVSMEAQPAFPINAPRTCQAITVPATAVFAPALTLDISSFVAPFRISR